ncbi:hypothetical protein G7Y79_00001g000050 [Physcia stellaris]|nr:hypothetical protein G7Y79_00001g000050 [Physcia stellaris]
MSSEEFISMDWRSAPTTSEIIERIEKLLYHLDQNGSVSLCLSNTTAKGALVYRRVDGNKMLQRRIKQTVRRGTTPSNRDYFYQLYQQARTLMEMQLEQQALKSRFIAYKDVEPSVGMKLDKTKRLTLDLALTVKIHPIALGIKREVSSQVSVPANIEIESRCITDIFQYNDRIKRSIPEDEYSRMNKLTFGTRPVPEVIIDLRVTKPHKKSKVDAVLVTEHRNLDEVLLKDGAAVEHVIIVMTAGFPDSGTKEFLHLLAMDQELAKVPFIYFGDHDIAGFSIFQVLKYGSKTSAWANAISVCPQLSWQVDYKTHHPHATDAQVTAAADVWQKKTKRAMNGKLTALKKKDQDTVRGFRSIGWLEDENLIRREIRLMEKEASVFRLANMAQAGTAYVRQFVEAKISELCSTRVDVQQPLARPLSPITQVFRDVSSQVETQPYLNAVMNPGIVSNNQGDSLEVMEEVVTNSQGDSLEIMPSEVAMKVALSVNMI